MLNLIALVAHCLPSQSSYVDSVAIDVLNKSTKTQPVSLKKERKQDETDIEVSDRKAA